MKSIQKRRNGFAHLFQMVILFFILFNAYSEARNPIRVQSDLKPLLCISSGSSVVVREASEPLSASLFLVKLHSELEKTGSVPNGHTLLNCLPARPCKSLIGFTIHFTYSSPFTLPSGSRFSPAETYSESFHSINKLINPVAHQPNTHCCAHK